MAQINKPTDFFNSATYTGAGTTTQSVTGVGFQPDFIWIKNRSDGYSHVLQDVVRGFGATYNLVSNSTSSEGASGATGDNYGHVSTADSDGFTVTHTINASNDGGTIRKGTHYSGNNYVGWNWLGGGTASSNTDGTITSSVSANTTSGFSIVSYTGTGSAATVGHCLGVAPKMIIVKGRDTAVNWYVYHEAIGNQTYLNLNGTGATGTPNSAYWNSTSPTSSVFSLGTGGDVNGSGQSKIAYCFAEKKGYSKFGSYTGNGSTNGTFVYTGFSPSWVMVRRTNNTGEWYILDNKRNTFNVADKYLQAQAASAEGTFGFWDFCSNGFKIKGNTVGMNGSGDTYIYYAIAESPLVGTNNIPTVAR